MPGKTIHESTRNVFSFQFRVISWMALAEGKDNTKLGKLISFFL